MYLVSIQGQLIGRVANTVLLSVYINCFCLLVSDICLVLMKFLNMKLCSIVIIYEYFGSNCSLHLYPENVAAG